MTLGEGKKKVLMLMDEYSSGGTLTADKDIEGKMNDFFDLAQKNVAGYQKIVRRFVPGGAGNDPNVTAVGQEFPAPMDFGGVFRVWRDGRITGRYPWMGNSILIPTEDVGRVTVEYFAIPAGIPEDAKDDYIFEVSEAAAACMPFFVAAQQLVVDLIIDPDPLLAIYDRMVSALDMRLPSGGGGRIRQGLYR